MQIRHLRSDLATLSTFRQRFEIDQGSALGPEER